MRRAAVAIVLVLAGAALRAAPAQVMPPSIKKPIDAAKKAAAKTNEQTRAVEKAGAEGKAGALPAAAAQAGARSAPGARGAQGAPTKADSARAAQAADSAARRGSASQSGGKGTVTFYREEFSYSDEGRRDPFVSLMASGELKPLLADLSLIAVLYDHVAPNRSVAVLEDVSTRETYRVTVGDVVGRMKVVKIGQQDITFSIDEFGFSRQETLPVDLNRRAGGQPGRRPQ
ncbi:MAG TPA: hypothetical protein VJL28_14195 [Gemmatimonadaceae bacterium]|nr:hypothetical protein [Gemmatimonadaceae bacterium]